MNEEINIYCDESCYLQHDNSQFMSIGGIWCLKDKIIEINAEIKKIKESLCSKQFIKKKDGTLSSVLVISFYARR